MTESTLRLGRSGEQLAAQFLERAGLEVLSRNWRSGRRELDLVVRDGAVVAFVEVKTRRHGPQSPTESVTRAQRRRLRGAAEAWIHAHPGTGHEFRFDVVGIVMHPHRPPTLVHITDAFTGDDC
jgi:putative endonuclease